jgi:hypothetical protein
VYQLLFDPLKYTPNNDDHIDNSTNNNGKTDQIKGNGDTPPAAAPFQSSSSSPAIAGMKVPEMKREFPREDLLGDHEHRKTIYFNNDQVKITTQIVTTETNSGPNPFTVCIISLFSCSSTLLSTSVFNFQFFFSDLCARGQS